MASAAWRPWIPRKALEAFRVETQQVLRSRSLDESNRTACNLYRRCLQAIPYLKQYQRLPQSEAELRANIRARFSQYSHVKDPSVADRIVGDSCSLRLLSRTLLTRHTPLSRRTPQIFAAETDLRDSINFHYQDSHLYRVIGATEFGADQDLQQLQEAMAQVCVSVASVAPLWPPPSRRPPHDADHFPHDDNRCTRMRGRLSWGSCRRHHGCV